MKQSFALIPTVALIALTSRAAADVLVVDADGGAPFTTIQSAVDAAVDGDTIYLKRSQLYTSFTVDNKALTIAGLDNPDWPDVVGTIQIKNLAAGKTFTLSSMRCIGSSGTPDNACLRITSCSGAVRFARAVFIGQTNGTRGALVDASPNVTFAGCTFLGVFSGFACTGPSMGPAGLHVSSSNAALYHCSLFGGDGTVNAPVSAIGGPGLLAETGSIAFSSGSTIQGGVGGPAGGGGCPPSAAGDGGPAIQLNAPVIVQLLDNTVIGGVPNPPPGPGADPGPQYASTGGASPFFYVVSNLGLRTPSIVHEGEYFQIEFTGDPGDQVYLNDGLSTSDTFDLVASWRGVVVAPFPPASPATRARRWGVIPASGHLKQIYRAPILPGGVEAETRFLQAYRIGANGLTLGDFATLTVLDSSL